MKRMFYGIGLGRSGTKTLANTINCAANAAVFHEKTVYPWLCFENRAYRGAYPKTVPFTWMLEAKYAKHEVVGDVNGYLCPFVKHIHDHNPNIRFIHLVRNPMGIITSWMNLKKPFNPQFANLQTEKYRWRPFPAEMRSRFAKICHYYVKANRRIKKHLQDTNHITVHIENLQQELPMIWRFLELHDGMGKAKKTAAKQYNKTKKQRLTLPWPKHHMQTFMKVVGGSEFWPYTPTT